MTQKKLTKSATNKVWTGTLGGIAEYFGIDATWVRIGYVVLAIFSSGFPGILLYLLLAWIIPNAPQSTINDRNKRKFNYNNDRKIKEAEVIHEDDWSDF
jgi:Putative stress-responsive transcriptional regulator